MLEIQKEYFNFLGINNECDEVNLGLVNKKCTIIKAKQRNNPEICNKIDEILKYFQTNDIYSRMDLPTLLYPRVYISGAKFATNPTMITEYGFTHILSIAEEFQAKLCGLTNMNLGLPDSKNIEVSKDYLDKCINFIIYSLNENENNKILIHCQFGRTRSAIIATYFISVIENLPIYTAYAKLQAIRDVIIPSELIQSLANL